MFANDICLFSPSLDGLQDLLNTCYHYAQSHKLFCNLCIVYGTTTSSNQNPRKFPSRFNSWKHIYQQIDEHESSQKHKACVEAPYDSAVIKQW